MRFDDASQPVSNGHSEPHPEPVARPDLDILPPGSFGPATGNAITGQGTNSGAAGADTVGGSATITQVQGAGGQTVVSNGNFQVPGQYGILQMDAQGNFNYVRNPNTPDGVKDVFNYTVADAAGNSSTTLTIDIAQVAAAAAGQGVVALPAGVALSDIHVNGHDLVINMPDGTQMVIPNGAVFVPEITIGDVQVPPTNIAALLIDSEPQPTAGPPSEPGGDWIDPVPPLAPGVPLGDLIPPTELNYTPPQFVNPAGALNEPPVAFGASSEVSEESLPTGNHDLGGSDSDTDSATASGSINASDPDGDSLTVTLGIPAGSYTSHGQAVNWSVSADGHTLIGYTGSDPTTNQVVVITINNSGAYNVQLVGAFDDPNPGEDSINFIVPATVGDGHGNSTAANITITVQDDTPIANNDTNTVNTDTNSASGNVITGAGETSGTAGADSYGADGPGSLTSVSSNSSGQSDSTFDSSGNLVVHGEFGTLTIKADGSYTYSLDANSHGGSSDVFTYTIKDGDGDTATATLTITVPAENIPPVASNSAVTVSEEALPTGNHDLGGSDSDDSSDVTTASGTINPSDANGDALTITLGIPAGTYTSGGQAVNWSVSSDGHTLIGYTGSDPSTHQVVIVTISNTGAYNVQLLAVFDDPAGNGENSINFIVPATVDDGHGGSTVADITVTVQDDTPIANNDTNTIGSGLSASGNVITGAGETSGAAGKDSFGADGPGAGGGLIGISSNFSHQSDTTFDSSGNLVVHGEFGTLTIKADGSYTYQLDANSHGGGNDVFTYTITDADGDHTTATLTIDVPAQNQPPTASSSSVTVSEEALATGNHDSGGSDSDDSNNPATDVTTASGTINASDPDGDALTITLGIPTGTYTSHGQTVNWSVSPDGHTLTGYTGSDPTANHVVVVTITDNTGAYTVQLLAPFDDPNGNGENSINFTVPVTVNDNHGASTNATIGVTVQDDTPTIGASGDEPSLTVSETALNTPDSANFAGAFSVSFGADGPAASNSLVYTLGVSSSGADSGLIDTVTGNHVFLFVQGGEVVGIEGTSAANALSSGETVFTVSVDASGNVSLDQVRAVVQPLGTNPDTGEGVSPIAGSITLTATATDYDGDQASQTINLGDHLTFTDAGPSVTVSGTEPNLNVFEASLGTGDTENFAAAFAVNFGPDGPASSNSVAYTLTISTSGADSGLIDTATGNHVFLFVQGGEVVGIEGTDAANALSSGQTVFTLSVDASGSVTLDQLRAVVQPDGTNPDTHEAVTLASAGLVSINATATDGDGDQSTASIAIGQNLFFHDAGPTISASGSEPSLTVSETTLGTPDSSSFASAFTINFGPDGAASSNSVVYALGVSSSGVDSGIVDTATGNHVFLFVQAGEVVGIEGTDAANALSSGQTVFTVSVDASGNVTLDQVRAVVQPLGTNPDTGEGVSPLATSITLTATVTDGDGDQASQQINLGDHLTFTDAGPTISANSAGPNLNVYEVSLGTGDTEGFAAAFTSSFGPDGPAASGATVYTLTISASGADSGLVDTASGNHVFLFLQGGEVIGKEGTNATTAASGPTVFTLSIDSSGNVTLDQLRAVVQPDGTNPDTHEAVSLASAGLVSVNATVTDGDGDSASASIAIGKNLFFHDAGPTISASGSEPSLTVSETALNTPDSSSFAGAFTINFGPDGAASSNSVVYALGVSSSGVDSGLIDTVSGNHVFLFLSGGEVIGKEGTNATTAASGPTVFTVSVDASGNVTLDQVRAVVQPLGTNPDTGEGVSPLATSITLTATVTDGDGDQASQQINLGDHLTFTDAGPTISANSAGPNLNVYEATLGTGDTEGFSAAFTSSFGPDGPAASGATVYTLTISASGADSGLVDTASGNHVFLFMSGGEVIGKEGTDATAAASGPTVFTLSIDSSGNVTLDQLRAVVQPDGTNPDTHEAVSLASAGLVSVNATVTDGDGDSASASIQIGKNLFFHDAGPSVSASGTEPTVTVSEVTLGTSASASFAGAFTVSYGPDGAAASNALTYVLGVSSSGVDSGLVDTASGNHVFLFVSGGEVVGKEGTNATTAASGPTVFTVSVDASGSVTLDQLRAVVQPDATNPDTHEPVSPLDTAITLTATATDGDGDSASQSVNIGAHLVFLDNGPSAITPATITTTDQAQTVITASLDTDSDLLADFNADGPGTVTFTGITNGMDSGLKSHGTEITYWLSADGQTLDARINSTNGTDGTLIFEVHIDQANSQYDYTQYDIVDNGSGVQFNNLTSTKAGTTSVYGIGADVTGNPDVDAMLTATSGGNNATVNTNADSIGIGNQLFNTGDSLRIDFVKALTTDATNTTLGFDYTQHVETNQFQQTVVSEQGNTNASFQVWALQTSDTQSNYPDSNPTGGFTDSTKEPITTVGIEGSNSATQPMVTVNLTTVGQVVTIAYGVTATLQSDGSVIFGNVPQGYIYEVETGSNSFNAVDVQDVAGKFKLGIFALGTTNVGSPVNLSYGLNITDGDGDSLSLPGAINITLNPTGTQQAAVVQNASINNTVTTNSTSTSSLAPGNDNHPTGTHPGFSVGHNAAVMAALAAAGLEAEHSRFDWHALAENHSSASAAKVPQFESFAASASQMNGNVSPTHIVQPAVASQNVVQGHGTGHLVSETIAHGHAAHDSLGMQSWMSGLLHGTAGVHAPAVTAGPIMAPAVSMPSAQQLAAALGAHQQPTLVGGEEHNQVVGKVLADALHGGEGHGPSIETLVNSHGGHVTHDVIEALASHAGSAVPFSNSALAAAFHGSHNMFSMAMAHHDAAPHHG